RDPARRDRSELRRDEALPEVRRLHDVHVAVEDAESVFHGCGPIRVSWLLIEARCNREAKALLSVTVSMRQIAGLTRAKLGARMADKAKWIARTRAAVRGNGGERTMSTLPYWSPVEKEGYIGAQTRWVDIGEGTRAFLGIPERGKPPY